MNALRHFIFDNWYLKLISLGLAGVLWAAVAKERSSEIGIATPLEYINVPRDTEILNDSTDTVEVRLRGPSALIREVSARDIATSIDLANMTPGDKIFPLSPQNIRSPFGTEVVRVAPSRVKVTLDRTIVAKVPVSAAFEGKPAEGFHVARVSIIPDLVEVQGPETLVKLLRTIETMPIKIAGKRGGISVTAELELTEPLIRLSQTAPVHVVVAIQPIR